MSLTKLTEAEFEQLADSVLTSLLAEARLQMQRKLVAGGHVLTSALLNSLHHESLVVGKELYAEFRLGFKGYGRFRDMKQLFYGKLPPVSAMEEFIRAVGLDKFKFIPGYLLGAKYRVLHIPEARAINRLAWTMAISRRQKEVIRQPRSKAFYNPTRGKLIYEIRDRVLGRIAQPILAGIKETLENG